MEVRVFDLEGVGAPICTEYFALWATNSFWNLILPGVVRCVSLIAHMVGPWVFGSEMHLADLCRAGLLD